MDQLEQTKEEEINAQKAGPNQTRRGRYGTLIIHTATTERQHKRVMKHKPPASPNKHHETTNRRSTRYVSQNSKIGNRNLTGVWVEAHVEAVPPVAMSRPPGCVHTASDYQHHTLEQPLIQMDHMYFSFTCATTLSCMHVRWCVDVCVSHAPSISGVQKLLHARARATTPCGPCRVNSAACVDRMWCCGDLSCTYSQGGMGRL